ncbi:MAG TPA: hypothetical protein VFZ61_04260 [Polyangiales bacterium]
MSEQSGQARGARTQDVPFRLSMRTDNPRRRFLCVALLALALGFALAGLVGAAPRWELLLPAGLFAAPGIVLLVGWLSPAEMELVLDAHTLRWGPVGGAQESIARRQVKSLYFSDEAAGAELSNGSQAPFPMEIVGGSLQQLARAIARLWPEIEIATRFAEDLGPSER